MNSYLKYHQSATGSSLSRRFSVTLSVVVLIIMLFFLLGGAVYNYYKIQRDLNRQLANTLELAETSLPTAVWQMDRGSMEDILEAILVNDAIVSARIITDNILAAAKAQPQYEALDFSLFRDSEKYTVKSVAVTRMGENVGLFEVAISRAQMTRGVLATGLTVLALVLVLCFAILMTSVLITRRYVFEPLMRLESHAKQIAGGNLESSIEIEGNNEFARLAAAYNFMANQLKISFDTLEQKVMERTADLYLAKTEAEKMNQDLRVVGAELQALLDNSPVGILFVGFDRRIQRVNPEITRITGYGHEELIGCTTERLYPSREIFLTLGETYYPILRKQGFCQSYSELQTKDGRLITCYWRGRTVVVEGGVEGVIWSLEDVSIRLKMEEELLKVKKLESIGVLAGGIAHDFNNLLLAIIGNISLARRFIGKDSRADELLVSAQKASNRAKDLTVKLLTFASGGDPVKSAEPLPQLLEESASFVLSGSNVKCNFNFSRGLWPVNMDKTQINQVIQNLVLNADQSMPEGGYITINCANINVTPGENLALRGGRYVRVSVTDSGIGIPQDILGRIFDPYFSTKEKDSHKGSGLGLAIVHSIISKHGGAITVDSSPGTGSTFDIYLPALDSLESTAAAVPEEIVSHGRGLILVMDDEEMIRNVVCRMLAHLGFKTVEARDGREALDLYGKHLEEDERFDAVIMDLTIPGGMGGEETVKKVLTIDSEAKVIVSSGYSSDPILDNYSSFGFCNIVSKPYQLHSLSRVLTQTLSSGEPKIY
ncbi:hybrid sensor histidine kinase/response regulator [Desulfopila inferna]|uniref:hybrid sensor histidine kinase/response regulator n=1 Tax=Desulfopila inferna TaxID=468528 RepID=UPI001966047E|nr:ATP-binding protein [Desulfopila inferna]MBM9605487.1 response regulator [Desulfopila inferna]